MEMFTVDDVTSPTDLVIAKSVELIISLPTRSESEYIKQSHERSPLRLRHYIN